MKQFQLITDGNLPQVRIVASTRAGFMTASLEGMFALAKPIFTEKDEDVRLAVPETERSFSVKADGFPALLASFLGEALKQSEAKGESFVGLRLSLITDKRAEGAFLGQPVSGWGRKLKAVMTDGLTVEKNLLGYWESTVTFQE